MSANALILAGYGLNCEEETKHAFETVGVNASIRHINDLIENPAELNDVQILAIPGGFSYGDDTGSGNAFAQKMRLSLMDDLKAFVARALKALEDNNQIAAKFVKSDGSAADGEFPYNPNGAIADIAAITDPSGRVLSIMPHPERGMFTWQRDDFTELKDQAQRAGTALPEASDGLALFGNAAAYFGVAQNQSSQADRKQA